MRRQVVWQALATAGVLAWLAGCASAPEPASPLPPVSTIPTAPTAPTAATPAAPIAQAGASTIPDDAPLPAPRTFSKSRWVPVRWAELPGLDQDNLPDAWSVWRKSCERPGATWAKLCPEVRRLSGASLQAQRDWMRTYLQPYRVEPLQGSAAEGLLTGYFEPVLQASRKPVAGYEVPLYRPPANLGARKPWYSRQEIDTLPEARAALAGREIVWLADPVDALMLQIQGSGRILVNEPGGDQRQVRLAYAGTNDQPYKSVGRWLIDQGQVREGSWPTIRAWIAQFPERVQSMLWSNPRVVFFREESLGPDPSVGPRGAQGVPLTAGRSIAVDPLSIPYGTPVWLASPGPLLALQRLVFAQDTGTAITGAVRADYFVGAGAEAGNTAGRLKQPLALWTLWPK